MEINLLVELLNQTKRGEMYQMVRMLFLIGIQLKRVGYIIDTEADIQNMFLAFVESDVFVYDRVNELVGFKDELYDALPV